MLGSLRHVGKCSIRKWVYERVGIVGGHVVIAVDGVVVATTGSNMFLFTDQMSLAASNPVDWEWLSGKREAVRLID